MSKIVLKADAIEKIYCDVARDVAAVCGVNFQVTEGESLAIVGPSGAGKSTLLHMLGGLDKPTKGRVFFDDKDIYTLKEKVRSTLRNKSFGFIFQFYHLLPDLTALENIALPRLVRENCSLTGNVKEEALQLLASVGLSERAHHQPYQLSGGEQQRVAIARALMNEPRVVFCDEPTGNLDSATGAEVMDVLLKLNQERRQTLVIVTHDQKIAVRMQRQVAMKDGKII